MVPIEKNIFVVDEQGNYYEATYPKRAKGLVKNGRARFINENTICLACPPCDMEDNKMSNNTEKLTMDYVLGQIEKIATETEYLHNAISELSKTISNGPGDIGAQARAQAFEEIVRNHETTNQKLLSLYEKMYDDLKSQDSPTERERLIGMMLGQLENPNVPPTTQDAIVDILATTLQNL